eukprot:376029_1
MGNSQNKQTVSILFLDVDGVLNCKETNGKIDDDKLILLKQIIDKTNAKIVISSSWRINKLNRLLTALNKHGMQHMDCTPYLQHYQKPEKNRVHEIESYLETAKKKYKINKWISIDDYNLVKYRQKFDGHFVNTSVFHGIRQKDVREAIKLLS